jgi:ankyrin repeat protein
MVYRALLTGIVAGALAVAPGVPGPARHRRQASRLNAELRLALGRSDAAAARALVRRGAGVDVRVERTALSTAAVPTVLMLACGIQDRAFVQRVLARGGKINAGDEDGWTPLMIAAAAGNAAIVEDLLRNRARPRAAARTGETALSLAQGTGNQEIVRLLKNAGASDQDSAARYLVRPLGSPDQVAVPGSQAVVILDGTRRVKIKSPEIIATCTIGHATCPNSLTAAGITVHLRGGLFLIQYR